MHATKNLKTRNPRGCNHRKGRYINMSLIIGSYIIDIELKLFISTYYGKEHGRTQYYGNLLSSYLNHF